MVRKPRHVGSGWSFHVMNRAIARRTAFEHEGDIRYFLALLARATRERGISLHAYSVLQTHFHLLVECREPRLSEAIGWVEQQYVRRFNRTRGRDGPLFRGRFVALHLDSEEYWETVVRYIDRNAVAAGIVERAVEYPFGSASSYAQARGPSWLERSRIEAIVRRAGASASYEPGRYAQVFRSRCADAEDWIVTRRMLMRSGPQPAITSVREWMIEHAMLADGIKPACVLVDPQSVLDALGDAASDGGLTLAAGLLRSCCGLQLREAAVRLGTSEATAGRRIREHRERLRDDATYASRAAEVIRSAHARVFVKDLVLEQS